jgi:transcriptional regulator with XRE-family HTH domain
MSEFIGATNSPTGMEAICIPPDSSQPIACIPTNIVLTEFHLSQVKLDKNGNPRPQQSLDNERSVIANWIVELDLDPQGPVGEELGVGFVESLSRYEKSLSKKGYSPRTISDRRCIIRKFKESFLEYQRTAGLPPDFRPTLRCLMSSAGISRKKLSMKCGINLGTLSTWLDDVSIPTRKSLPLIRKLEKFFKVPDGTLSSRIPEVFWTEAPDSKQTTPWREHQRVLTKLKYRLPAFPERLQGEWHLVERFFTDERWVLEQGLKRNSEWRIRWNYDRCITAEIPCDYLRGFYGFLCLSATNQDKRLEGMGFSAEEITLAQLTDADLVIKYLHFLKARSVSNSFNTLTLNFLAFCSMLIRKKTGYLRQLPEFGERLAGPVAADDWDSWCRLNRKKLQDFRKSIIGKKGKKSQVRMTRNPFEPVLEIIRDRQYPVTALFDVSKKLEALTPLLERGSKEKLALHRQNIFQVRLIASNPLRIEIFSMMRFAPKDYSAFERACEIYRRCRESKAPVDYSELYVETEAESNLYHKRDGSWHLRFDERDFKNEKGEDLEEGVLSRPYDVPVLTSVWPALVEYIFGGHFAVLKESTGDGLIKARSKWGLSPLNPDEELATLRCPYVFRTMSDWIKRLRVTRLDGYGTAQIRTPVLSRRIFKLTRRYLRGCKGFSAHACRHLVASDYIKNHPDGYRAAAAALHNSERIVRKHYAWVEVGDLMNPWNNYHEHLQELYEKGEI